VPSFFGGLRVGNEHLRSLISTSDGGYAIVGSSKYLGAGGYDLFIVKFIMKTYMMVLTFDIIQIKMV